MTMTMTRSRFYPCARRALSVAMLAVLSGCAAVSLEQNLSRVNDETGSLTGGGLSLARSEQVREQRAQATAKLLGGPVGQKEAIQLALVNSPALQALLAQGWAWSANAAQMGRLPNPVFSFERMVSGDELELGRALSVGLLDILTLPGRQSVARHHIEAAHLRLSSEVVDQVTQVSQAWVRAVAAKQGYSYAQQVFESAQASADLAQRMQAVGNFNRISRAREHTFYADAATRLATAAHQRTASREVLVRLLGLDHAQADILQLPDRLPDLPKQALAPGDLGQLATRGRLDIRLAQAELDAAARAQGLDTVTSFTDIELSARDNTRFDSAAPSRSDARGYEIAVRLPLFDSGDMQRAAMNARTLAAAHALQATVRAAGSHLRESYSVYRTAYDIARHHRDEVVPLRKLISDENLLRYNGMLIGVFELLADSREQVVTVVAALQAQQQFWLADAGLKATLIGRPTNTTLSVTPDAPSSGGAGH
jgi:outer membrane protein TolC